MLNIRKIQYRLRHGRVWEEESIAEKVFEKYAEHTKNTIYIIRPAGVWEEVSTAEQMFDKCA